MSGLGFRVQGKAYLATPARPLLEFRHVHQLSHIGVVSGWRRR